MNAYTKHPGQWFAARLLAGCAAFVLVAQAQDAPLPSTESEVEIVIAEGRVEVLPDKGKRWIVTGAGQKLRAYDQLRTHLNSRVVLRWPDRSRVTIGEATWIELLPSPKAAEGMAARLYQGILSFFHRDGSSRFRVIATWATAGVDGTEFVIEVDSTNTVLSVIDGRVRFGTELQAPLVLTNGQQAAALRGQAPRLTAGFISNNLLQWCFYYPGVLDPGELSLSPEEKTRLSASLQAYGKGDVLVALAKYRAPDGTPSPSERVYFAALQLSVGQAGEAEDSLSIVSRSEASDRTQRLAAALRQLIAAVKRQTGPMRANPALTTELLAASYYEQAKSQPDSLSKALALATRATVQSPGFGFAWVRRAELEFSFGRASRALESLNRGLELSPQNAEGLALKGFLWAAENRVREAIKWFDKALAVDPGLGNAWLGRGLCRIRLGDTVGGQEDLTTAAAIEPRRSLLRSYLGKADEKAGEYGKAVVDLKRAADLDPNDPTVWLYSALLNQQHNRINAAVRDLEESQALNDNRSVYRSTLLLDEDRAVRSANLAGIYQDAGLLDWSVREASRAVSYDYANYSAHLFLANSYDSLRDPNRVNLRYETPAESEYLIANLLSPASAGTMSQPISQGEYSRLFEQERFGVSSFTEYLSRGAWTESGAQYGTSGNSSYSVEAFYHSDPGQQENGDFEERTLVAKFKQQLSAKDSVFLQGTYYEAEGGDRAQYYDPGLPFPQGPNLELRTRENQDPILSLGYHHEWGPGVHTLVLASRLSDRYSVENPAQITFLVGRNSEGGIYGIEPLLISQKYRSELEIYSTELQQIWETDKHATIAGLRYQNGDFDTKNLQADPYGTFNGSYFNTPAQQTNFVVDFDRLSLYGYHQWQIAQPLRLIAGLSYDHVAFPRNFRAAPISSDRHTEEQLSPKAGLIWTPGKNTVVRGAYTRSLSGASIDQSSTLEPTLVAGFLQSFRSIIPESVGGAEAGAGFETFDAAFEQRFSSGTYLGLTAEFLRSDVERAIGEFTEPPYAPPAVPDQTPEWLRYEEKSLALNVDQLLGEGWSLGARYRLSRGDLRSHYPEVLPSVDAEPPSLSKGFRRNQHLDSILHQLSLHVIYNHPSGFFGQIEGIWDAQSNGGYSIEQPGDDFFHLNLLAGYRFPRRRAAIAVGLLNVTDQDYRLNPLSLYTELPRQRTFVARLQVNF